MSPRAYYQKAFLVNCNWRFELERSSLKHHCNRVFNYKLQRTKKEAVARKRTWGSQESAKAMTKNEHGKKRKRPINLGFKKLEKRNHQRKETKNNGDKEEDVPSAKRRNLLGSSKASSFLDKMRQKLSGGHFRMLNEKLYTCTGKEAVDYFQENRSLFDMYHAGYRTQMLNWPEQPVNVIINWLKEQCPSLVVADFGCGDAHIAKSVKNTVFSLDLVSNDPKIIACDMSNTPLASSSVEVAVFCLSLMGTNYRSYIEEATRVLKPCGWLLIAEVKSRFDPNTGGADPKGFLMAICELGFRSVRQDKQNAKGKEIE